MDDQGDIIILNMRTRYVNRITRFWNHQILGGFASINGFDKTESRKVLSIYHQIGDKNEGTR